MSWPVRVQLLVQVTLCEHPATPSRQGVARHTGHTCRANRDVDSALKETENWPMDSELEAHRVAQVIERLGEKFPDVDREQIEIQVHRAHHALAGHPIRDYVPILVEYDAKDLLRRLTAGASVMSNA
jgi:hypothetical protein